jgi:hypothetical protein
MGPLVMGRFSSGTFQELALFYVHPTNSGWTLQYIYIYVYTYIYAYTHTHIQYMYTMCVSFDKFSQKKMTLLSRGNQHKSPLKEFVF